MCILGLKRKMDKKNFDEGDQLRSHKPRLLSRLCSSAQLENQRTSLDLYWK